MGTDRRAGNAAVAREPGAVSRTRRHGGGNGHRGSPRRLKTLLSRRKRVAAVVSCPENVVIVMEVGSAGPAGSAVARTRCHGGGNGHRGSRRRLKTLLPRRKRVAAVVNSPETSSLRWKWQRRPGRVGRCPDTSPWRRKRAPRVAPSPEDVAITTEAGSGGRQLSRKRCHCDGSGERRPGRVGRCPDTLPWWRKRAPRVAPSPENVAITAAITAETGSSVASGRQPVLVPSGLRS
jgi:hypothetical protein